MRFEGFSGNESLRRQFSAMEESGRVPHAVILEGADDETRGRYARLLTQWAVCTAEEGRPCGVCGACVKAARGVHPDVFAAQGGAGARSFHVDVIREIREDAYILPNEAEHKVYLLEGADTMTEQAQNALLKILEEPPAYALFILTCGSAAGLLPTVRSRAQIFTLEDAHGFGAAEKRDEAAQELALKLAAAAAAPREYEMVALTGSLVKDKDLLRAVLQRLVFIFREACICAAGGGQPSAASAALCGRFTAGRLLKMLETVRSAQQMQDQNANQTLLISWLCAKLREKEE